MMGERPERAHPARIKVLGVVMLSVAVLAGWVIGSALLSRGALSLEDAAHSTSGGAVCYAQEADPSAGQGPVSKVATGRIRGGATVTLPSWRVAWDRARTRLLPLREDYRIARSAPHGLEREYEIFEGSDHLRTVRVRSPNERRWLVGRSAEPGPLSTMQLLDTQGMPVHGSAMLVDTHGAPWGPVTPAPIRLPQNWRGYVLVRGYASTPVQIRAQGLMRMTLHPSADISATISSEGLSLVGNRFSLRVLGANVGSNPGRWVRLEGRTQVRLRGLRRGQSVIVELHSELHRFDVARAQIQLERAVNELEIVARAYAEVRVVTSDPSLFGQTLYIAPFYAKDPEARTLDFRYPWRALEWNGSYWPLSRLRTGSLDFWVWTEGGRFGRLGKAQILAGSKGMELEATLAPIASPTLHVRTHSLLGSRTLEVIVFDASYVGHPENLLRMKKQMPGLRVKTWTVEAGRTLRMRGLWKRSSHVVIRSEEGATLWEGTLDLEKDSSAQLNVQLAIGGLIQRSRGVQIEQRSASRIYSKKTGEVVGFPVGARGATRALLLREGGYEVRGPGMTTRAIHVVAGRVARF